MRYRALLIRSMGAALSALFAASLAVLAFPASVDAQGKGVARGQKHDQIQWKHDFVPPGPPWWRHDDSPPGPPCLVDERPCPPGQFIRNDTDRPGFAGNGRAFSQATPFGRLAEQVRLGALPTPSPVPPGAQGALALVWLEDAPSESAALTLALTSRGNESAEREARTLVEALDRLPTGDAWLVPTVEAFNAFVDASTLDYLRDPAPEFLVLHAFLGELLAPVGNRSGR